MNKIKNKPVCADKQEKREKALKKAWVVISVVLMVGMTLTMPVFAADNEYAKAGAMWILDGIFWLVLVGGIFGAGMAAIKRNFSAALGIILGAAFIAVLCKNPEILSSLGTKLKEILGL